ncbi:MAG: D-alanyl-D-alanine carboxypeptidase [Nitriliruptor sp.]|nr:MAG: D-alanyl-D-alanine carboxypeptidase [Nitriliruptor sp.]
MRRSSPRVLRRGLIAPGATVVVLLTAMVSALLVAPTAPAVAQSSAPSIPEPVLTDAPGPTWPGPDPIDAEAYVLIEVATGQRLAALHADTRRPVASTVKLLTAYTVIQRADLDAAVTVGDEVLDVPGSGVGLQPGDEWTVEELLDGLLARSGNDAAETLAVHVGGTREGFVALMEQDAAALGVTGLDLTSPSGLDDTQLFSASDLAVIGLAVLQDDDLPELLARQVVTLPGQPAAETRNELLDRYPGATGMKTGFTTPAGHSLVGSAQRGERDLIAVVLGAGEDPSRFDGTATLLDHGFGDMAVSEVGTSIQILLAGGAMELVVPPTPVTVPSVSEASLQLTLPVRPSTESLRFPVLVDGEELGVVTTAPTGGPAPLDPGPSAMGRALVDGAYAALRAASAAGTL